MTDSARTVREIVSEKERLEIKEWIEAQICDYRSLPSLGATSNAMFLQHRGMLEAWKLTLNYLYERDSEAKCQTE